MGSGAGTDDRQLTTLKYSRLTVSHRAKDDALVGLLALHAPLGLLEEGGDLVACFRSAEVARAARRTLERRGYRAALTTDLAEGDPLEAFRAASRPFPVGRRFWLDPGDPGGSSAPRGRVLLRVPASRAFGTGGHESTRLALEALEEEVAPGAFVLDVGTGSGILALAAVALGARRALGFDTDADAVFVARENVRRHSFGSRVGLFAGEIDATSGRFDVVAANLLPEEALPILTLLSARVAAGGRVVLSGIPAERELEILARARRRRLRLTSRHRDNGWSCLCLTRASS